MKKTASENIQDALKDLEFLKIIKPILEHPEFKKRITYEHHEDLSVYEHCLDNAYSDYLQAKKQGLSTKEQVEATYAGIMHDFYPFKWMFNEERANDKLFKKHGFTHAKEASQNAAKFFPVFTTRTIQSSIESHMWPLNLTKVPRGKVAFLVNLTDTISGLSAMPEISEWGKYLGLASMEDKPAFEFEDLHACFHDFTDEFDIDITGFIMDPITRIQLRMALYEYAKANQKITDNIEQLDTNHVSEAIKQTIDREELLVQADLALNSVEAPYTNDDILNLLGYTKIDTQSIPQPSNRLIKK